MCSEIKASLLPFCYFTQRFDSIIKGDLPATVRPSEIRPEIQIKAVILRLLAVQKAMELSKSKVY